MRKINYKSDFGAILRLYDSQGKEVGFPDQDFKALFYTPGNKANAYTASCIGGECTNCYNDNGVIHVVFDNHRMGVGQLKVEFTMSVADARYPDGHKDTVSPYSLDLELVLGKSDDIDDSEIEFIVPYAVIDAYDMAVSSGYTGTREEYITGLNALPDLAYIASDVSSGKEAIASALTRAGAATESNESLTDMAAKIGTLPLGGSIVNTLIPDLPQLVAENRRADYPYVAAVSTTSSEFTLEGADAYMALGLDFTEEHGGTHTFPIDYNGLSWVLFYFKSPEYAVPYNSVGVVYSVYCYGGHPAWAATESKGLFLEAFEDEGVSAATDGKNLSKGDWKVVASNMTEYSGGTLASSCGSLTTLSLPMLADMHGGTLANICISLATLSLPMLADMHGGTLVQFPSGQGGVFKTLSLPMLAEMHGGTLASSCGALTTLSLPMLAEMHGGTLASSCGSLTTLSLPKLKKLLHGFIAVNIGLTELTLPELELYDGTGGKAPHLREICIADFCGNLKTLRLPKLREVKLGGTIASYCNSLSDIYMPMLEAIESVPGNTGDWESLLWRCGTSGVTLHLDSCKRFDISNYWTSATLLFGSAIEYIHAYNNYGEGVSAVTITIGQGAVCEIRIDDDSNKAWSIKNKITEESLHQWVEALGDNSNGDTKQIQIGAENIAKLSEEEIAILVAKNYSLS